MGLQYIMNYSALLNCIILDSGLHEEEVEEAEGRAAF
jgi:hypothetical protein